MGGVGGGEDRGKGRDRAGDVGKKKILEAIKSSDELSAGNSKHVRSNVSIDDVIFEFTEG